MSLFNQTKEVQLNDKEDDAGFIQKFKALMEDKLKAVFDEPRTIGPVGSQITTIIPFKIGSAKLHLTSETFMGIKLTGPATAVNEINQVLKKVV